IAALASVSYGWGDGKAERRRRRSVELRVSADACARIRPMTPMLFTVALAIASQQPPQNCRPVKGTFLAKIVKEPPCPRNVFCTAGELIGDVQGHYAFHVTGKPKPAKAPGPAATVQFFVGESTVTLERGETLHGIDTGAIDEHQGGFASLVTWTDGATGQIRLRGVGSATTTSG